MTVYIKTMYTDLIYIVSFLSLIRVCSCSDTREYLKSLLANYTSDLKPRKNLSEPVEITTMLHVNSLREISERYQTMTFAAWFELTWIDEFLVLREGIESLGIPIKNVWIPDISLFNSVEDPQHMSDGTHVVLLRDGKVVWYPAREYTVRCEITIRYYPFDTQECEIRFGAWQAPTWTQIFKVDSNSLNMDTFGENGEWSVVKHYVESNFSEAYSISWIRFVIHFQRRPLFALLNTVFPIILLSLLNTLTFRLPADSGEKITLCISVMLAFTVFLTVFSENMPKVSTEISYLSVYLCVQLALSGLAIAGSVFIWRVKHSSNKPKTETMDSIKKSQFPLRVTKIVQNESRNNGDPFIVGYKYKKDDDIFQINGHDNLQKSDSNQNDNERNDFIDSASKCLDNSSDFRRSIERIDNILFVVSLTTTIISTSVLFLLLQMKDQS